MKINILIIQALLVTIIIFSCDSKESADLIIFNGYIYSVDENFSLHEAMAVKDGKILQLGKNDELKSRYKATQVIDLEGKYVYPGFIDPHSHFIGYAMNLQRANLWMSESMEEIVARLITHHQNFPSEWLLGRGWDQNLFEIKEMPDNKLLNESFPDIPVYIVR